jgi:hypothetical protein
MCEMLARPFFCGLPAILFFARDILTAAVFFAVLEHFAPKLVLLRFPTDNTTKHPFSLFTRAALELLANVRVWHEFCNITKNAAGHRYNL